MNCWVTIYLLKPSCLGETLFMSVGILDNLLSVCPVVVLLSLFELHVLFENSWFFGCFPCVCYCLKFDFFSEVLFAGDSCSENSITCMCENGKYLKRIADDSQIVCDETMYVMDILQLNLSMEDISNSGHVPIVDRFSRNQPNPGQTFIAISL